MFCKYLFNLPGDNSDTGVLEGVGLCPGGRKCEGEPLLEPLLPFPPKKNAFLINCIFEIFFVYLLFIYLDALTDD